MTREINSSLRAAKAGKTTQVLDPPPSSFSKRADTAKLLCHFPHTCKGKNLDILCLTANPFLCY